MLTSQYSLSAFCVLANILGVQLGLAGVRHLKEIPSIPFYQPDGMYFIILPFGPVPPNWLIFVWASGGVSFVVISIVLSLAAALLLLPRGRPISGWLLLGSSTLAFAGTGLWIWLHAAFNAEALAGL